MDIDFSSLSPSKRYHLMTQTVLPRPIAWVLSKNSDESFNLAPFSYFNAISSEPPLLMISVGMKPTGETKDTAQNLQQGQSCVVHIPSVQHAQDVTASAATLPYGVSELDQINACVTPQDTFELPRLTTCLVAFNCIVHEITKIDTTPQTLIFLEIKSLHVADDVVVQDAKGRDKFDAAKIKPLARLGANEYASLSDVISLVRPE